MQRRQILQRGFGLTLLGAALPPDALADSFPSRPLKLLVGFPPGGGVDFIARSFQTEFSSALGQPVVIENRPGAAGVLAASLVARAPADGYTLLLSLPASITSARVVMKGKLQYAPETDFDPIGMIGVSPVILLVRSDSSIKTLADFKKTAQTAPGGMSVGSYGVGSPGHFALEIYKSASQLPLVHVPFNGSAPAVTALLAGEVPATFDAVGASLPHIRPGKVRVLAVAAGKRATEIPDAPTFLEAGGPRVEMRGWAAVHAPKGTPSQVIERLNSALNQALNSSTVRSRLDGRIEVVPATPTELKEFVRSEREQIERLVQTAGLQFD